MCDFIYSLNKIKFQNKIIEEFSILQKIISQDRRSTQSFGVFNFVSLVIKKYNKRISNLIRDNIIFDWIHIIKEFV